MIVPERFRYLIGVPLFLVCGFGLVHQIGLTGPTIPHVHFRLWEVLPFSVFALVLSVAQRAYRENRTIKRLRELADSIEDFRQDMVVEGVRPFDRQWRKTQGEYVRRFGKEAARMLKGTPYGASPEYALKPAQLRDFKVVAVLLRARANSFPQTRRQRWIKNCVRDTSLAAMLFLALWASLFFHKQL